MFQPTSPGITYELLDRVAADHIPLVTIGYGRADAAEGRVFPWVFPLIATYWSQASAIVNYLGMRYGFTLDKIPVPHPGNVQREQWHRIGQIKPDYVILWGFGVMNPIALITAAETGFPRERIVGVWWSGSEEDVLPAGPGARGFVAAGFNVAGANYPVIQEILRWVYAKGGGNLGDPARVGSVNYNRGVVYGLLTAEAIRKAQERFGRGMTLNGEQMRWGFEHLEIDNKTLATLGATGFMPELKISCADHEGAGKVRFQEWNGKNWRLLTDWVEADHALVHQMVEASAAAYAKDKGITPRDCARER